MRNGGVDASRSSWSAMTPLASRSRLRMMLVWRSPADSTEANSEYRVPSYQSPAFAKIFAAGIAFVPPYAISVPARRRWPRWARHA